MRSDSLIFVPGRCSHFGAPKETRIQNLEPLEELYRNDSNKEDVPISKVTKILKRTETKLNQTEIKPN